MDFKSERDSLKAKDRVLTELYKKLEFSNKAYDEITDLIVGSKEITGREAVELAFRYLEVSLENLIMGADAHAREIELTKQENFKSWTEEDFRVTHEQAREVEAALVGAVQRGDYREIKKYIANEGQYKSDEGTKLEILGERLCKLADLIPEHGDLLKLSVPAWMDPKYNPDASPLPLQKQESAD